MGLGAWGKAWCMQVHTLNLKLSAWNKKQGAETWTHGNQKQVTLAALCWNHASCANVKDVTGGFQNWLTKDIQRPFRYDSELGRKGWDRPSLWLVEFYSAKPFPWDEMVFSCSSPLKLSTITNTKFCLFKPSRWWSSDGLRSTPYWDAYNLIFLVSIQRWPRRPFQRGRKWGWREQLWTGNVKVPRDLVNETEWSRKLLQAIS